VAADAALVADDGAATVLGGGVFVDAATGAPVSAGRVGDAAAALGAGRVGAALDVGALAAVALAVGREPTSVGVLTDSAGAAPAAGRVTAAPDFAALAGATDVLLGAGRDGDGASALGGEALNGGDAVLGVEAFDGGAGALGAEALDGEVLDGEALGDGTLVRTSAEALGTGAFVRISTDAALDEGAYMLTSIGAELVDVAVLIGAALVSVDTALRFGGL